MASKKPTKAAAAAEKPAKPEKPAAHETPAKLALKKDAKEKRAKSKMLMAKH